jgi:hypothetical protein
VTPIEYLTEVVKPNLADLAADYDSIRHNLNAVHSVDALAAHVYYASNGAAPGKDDLDYRDHLAKQHPEFALLRDIAKAIKHVRLIRGSPQASRGDQMVVRSLGWGEAAWGDGRWGGPPQAVIPLDSGGIRVVETVAVNALKVLEQEMATYGLDSCMDL